MLMFFPAPAMIFICLLCAAAGCLFSFFFFRGRGGKPGKSIDDMKPGPKKDIIVGLRDNAPEAHSEILQSFAEGDYVILHVHSLRQPGTRGRASIEIFRLENGLIDEYWDVIQEIPETSANPNGMF